MNKSKVAFIMSVEKLFDESEHVYMWTLTFREVMPVWWYMNTHTLFVREVQKWYKNFKGLRVTEVHDMHGIHYHWLVDTWMDADLIRMIGKRFGIGRVHVVEADRGAALYLAKYMSKKGQAPMFRKLSKWGTLGGFVPCRVGDIEIQSKTRDRLDKLRAVWCSEHKKKQVPFGEMLRLIHKAIMLGDEQ
ncbi:hypothetical protein OH491_07750 [Termitidicoccus mucosus]|uniref:Replication-associated protein ORF2/G2P domain-containing protein n=1 Tax=Termitidicoccus mucosus TaxID=1184151 RepID=A0A178IG93_9BACT|nr:hypothetical protein AW736_21305 [Opitutaceae bacterium TSB47]